MPLQRPNLIRFNGGVVSPKLRARVDLDDYEAMMSDCTSFIPLKYGEAQAMTGFLFGAETKTNSKKSVFIPFQYSATDSAWIELGDLHMRFVNPSDGTYYGAPTELVTPYTEAELYDVQYQTINDVIILTHENHHPQQVTRTSDTVWTIADYQIDFPAFLSENLDPAHYIAPSGTTGSVTLTATGTGNEPFDFPTNDMIGSHVALTQRRSAQSVTSGIDASFTSANVKVKGDWSFKLEIENPADAGTDDVTLERSDDGGSTWVTIFTVTLYAGYTGFDISGTIEEDEILFRFGIDGSTANTIPTGSGYGNLTLTTTDIEVSGYAEITAIASTTSATGTVIVDFESTEKTNKWRIGGWSDEQGYPKAATVFEQRVFFGGTTKKPTAIWASATDDIGSFDFRNTEADDAFFRVIDNSQNSIQWMARKDKVFIGTSGEEFFLSSSNEQEAITPSNVTVKTSGGNGSAAIKPISLGSSLAFVTLNGVQLRELAFDASQGNNNSDIDLTELSDEITGTGILQLAYQQYPNRTIYAVREDGVLLGFVFDKQNGIKAWYTRPTDGVVESVVSTRDGAGLYDPLGIIVKRTINGVDKRYIETLAEPTSTNSDWVYMDSAVQVSSLGSASVTGATHLEGKTVTVMNDGAYESDKVVTSGAFTLDNTSSTKVVYGLKYDAEFTTLPIQVNTGDGNPKGKPKTISHVMLGVRDSLAGQYGFEGKDDEGNTLQHLDNVHDLRTGALVMGVAQDSVTRFHRLPMEASHYRELSLRVVRNRPVPLNVTHAIPAMEAGGD